MILVRKLKANELAILEKYRILNPLLLEIFKRHKKTELLSTMNRYQILLSSIEGKKNNQIAIDLNCSAQTVRKTINNFNEFGFDFIYEKRCPVSKIIEKGKMYKSKGLLEKAIKVFSEAIALYPTSAWSYYYLGETLVKQCNFNNAIVCFKQAIKLNSTTSDHYNKLGEVYFTLRQLDKAVDSFRKALSLYPKSAWYTQNLAEALAQQHKWGDAVTYYRHALKLNPDEVSEYHNSLKIKSDDPNFIKVNDPIFIVGCGHSGTSIMLAILSNYLHFHPITYESALFKRSESEIREIMFQWDKDCIEAKKKRWIEKTPPHIFHIKRLLLHRPQSKFIIMLRDGRDVVCSLKKRVEYTDFNIRMERWIYDNLAGLPYWNHPQVIVVKYENLVSNTKTTLKKILDFLGENYTSEILDYYKHQKLWYYSKIKKPEEIETHEDHHQLRNWQINQPLFDGRGQWKSELNKQEKKEFKKQAQKYLLAFGYVQDECW